ncbi:SIR2 family protein [Acinetobacter sp. YK3]|uniref:SIR2 family protein n=1 Tax=Acinetobacter sp. YK3 TaxID=1860097 RepID=UPI00148AC1DB|nr:SIR2 family protein [Acinetobacter sp. YK3]
MKSKTIFVGNGINYLGGTPISWSKLLKELMKYEQFDFDELPYAMAYEKIRFDWQAHYRDQDSSRLKQHIAEKLKDHPGNPTCQKILESGFTNYITTNYDYAIENSFKSLNNKNTFSNSEKNDQQGEKYYSIRRKTELKTGKDTVGIVWHIHGEIDPCNSIMLGFNHYVGSVAKVDSYMKGKYRSDSNPNIPKIKKIEKKIATNSYDSLSWVELFFNSDVHIAGFSFDFYEIDLWNILTKRARLKSQINNRIYYYTKPLSQIVNDAIKKVEIRKRQMLEILSVEIREVELHKNDLDEYDYIRQWDEFIELMRTE